MQESLPLVSPPIRVLKPQMDVITKRMVSCLVNGKHLKRHLLLKIKTISPSLITTENSLGSRVLTFYDYPSPLYEFSVLNIDDKLVKDDLNLIRPISNFNPEWAHFTKNPLFSCTV